MPTIKELCERLLRDNKPDDVVAAHIWCAEDVLGRAKELHYNCTLEQANEILEDIERHIDCELGITWDTLDSHIEEKCEQKEPCKTCAYTGKCTQEEEVKKTTWYVYPECCQTCYALKTCKVTGDLVHHCDSYEESEE